MSSITADVCVIGAGPAGSAVAQRLASLGHSVVVVEACAFPRRRVGESLAASVLPLLDLLGTRAAVETAGFLPSPATWLRWSAGLELRQSGALHVDRARFDRILLNAARDAGARILQPAAVVSARRTEGRWRAIVRTGDEPVLVSARAIVDSAGRRGWLPGSRRGPAWRTIAIWAYWNGVPFEGAEARVEAGKHQWYWGAPLPGGNFVAAVFVGAAEYQRNLRACGGREAIYTALLAESELLRPCLAGNRTSRVEACDASPYVDTAPAGESAIRIGEAAFAIDPLSSQGVQAALGSAVHAAAALHTILKREYDAPLAVEFYCHAVREAASFHERAAAAAYRAAFASQATDFWERRASGAASSADPVAPSLPLRTDSIVQLAPGARVEAGPIIRGEFVVAGHHVVLPDGRRSFAFLDDVELEPLLATLRAPTSAARVIEMWAPRVPAGRAEAMLHWLWSHGVLRAAGCQDGEAG